MSAIRFDPAALKRTHWHEYAIRFIFGGVITVITGILAKEFGPVFGGLFLAFPAIFPASATLVEKHEKKKRRSDPGTSRGRLAAALDARGAILGGAGLICFAAAMWLSVTRSAPLAFVAAIVAWLAASVMLWYARRPGFSIAAKRRAKN